MAWIELHQSVWDHRKTLILAAELDLENKQKPMPRAYSTTQNAVERMKQSDTG